MIRVGSPLSHNRRKGGARLGGGGVPAQGQDAGMMPNQIPGEFAYPEARQVLHRC